jgi:hypothetical protein
MNSNTLFKKTEIKPRQCLKNCPKFFSYEKFQYSRVFVGKCYFVFPCCHPYAVLFFYKIHKVWVDWIRHIYSLSYSDKHSTGRSQFHSLHFYSTEQHITGYTNKQAYTSYGIQDLKYEKRCKKKICTFPSPPLIFLSQFSRMNDKPINLLCHAAFLGPWFLLSTSVKQMLIKSIFLKLNWSSEID